VSKWRGGRRRSAHPPPYSLFPVWHADGDSRHPRTQLHTPRPHGALQMPCLDTQGHPGRNSGAPGGRRAGLPWTGRRSGVECGRRHFAAPPRPRGASPRRVTHQARADRLPPILRGRTSSHLPSSLPGNAHRRTRPRARRSATRATCRPRPPPPSLTPSPPPPGP